MADDKKLSVEVYDNEKKIANRYILDLAGFYQLKNLLTVLSTVDQLKGQFFIAGRKY